MNTIFCRFCGGYYDLAEFANQIYHNCIPKDVVNQPAHYTQGIECWDYITSHKMSFLEGNIIKYVTRYKSKNGREDLLKAQAYLEKLLKETK